MHSISKTAMSALALLACGRTETNPGRWIANASDDRTVKLWRVQPLEKSERAPPLLRGAYANKPPLPPAA